VEGLSFVRGKKGRRFVHVAGVDSIVTEREVRDAAEKCVNTLGGQASWAGTSRWGWMS